MENKLKIKNVIRETEEAITIQFENHPLLQKYAAGQFINISSLVGSENISRSYSFSSAPEVDELPAVTVKKVTGGRLSGHLIASLRAGDMLEVSEPMGRFSLQIEGLDEKHLIFIAGGSGITPLFSMIKTALKRSESVRITLLYGNRNTDSIIFLAQLRVLQAQHAERLKVVHFLQEGAPDKDIPYCYSGYISKDFLVQVVQAHGSLTSEIYLCGPEGMMNTVSAYLQELGYDPGRIYRESYGQAKERVINGETAGVKSDVTFIKGGETFHLQLSADESILQAGLAAGLPLPHSCKEAMCGSCKVKLLSGKVNMQENYALTDSQLKEGYVLLCSGRPASERITLIYS